MKKTIALLTLAFTLTACNSEEAAPVLEIATPEQPVAVELTAEEPAETKTFTLAEIAENSTEASCWMAIDGMVYDVTNFISSHPGGEAILNGCGKDASEMFEGAHDDGAREGLPNYYIGELAS